MIGVRLQLGDPVAQLRHLEKLSILLHLHRPHPEDVGDQPAKAAQHYGGERERRGRFSICSVCVSLFSARKRFILLWLRLTANRKTRARRARRNLNALPWILMPCQFIEAVGFGSANSLRWNIYDPSAITSPPMTMMIAKKAQNNAAVVIVRPSLRLSTGE